MSIMNEKIRAAEVKLAGLDGEDLGVVSREQALALAREAKADLVCTSLMSSPPPCALVPRGQAKSRAAQEKRQAAAASGKLKYKELRLGTQIGEHDYDTKRRQAAKQLGSGGGVTLVVPLRGKEGPQAKALLERLLGDLREAGRPTSGIQLSGKQAMVQVAPH
ncbi:translation initiation factor IF-3 [Paenibacillus sp. IB182496]|uniref:Translation initiation factor IF-3 n=1 Tax=Paenibacillus sabuli TaxID=2772509 RepID=A0A927BS77_9BACL|nr:translation initiation factor IF-3 [Paenibacillus sabuli]MBD2844790.1 translation initiation factor IF-3 [Paenibacillus sabuli]